MKTLTGILVDVSGSMENSLQLNVIATDQRITRVESIFNTIMNIAKREVDSHETEEIFTLAFGLRDVTTCDLLSLLEYVKTLNKSTDDDGHELFIRLLANHGAPRADKYVRQHLTKNESLFLYNFYSENLDMLKELVEKLPRICKEKPHPIDAASQAGSWAEEAFESRFRSDNLSTKEAVLRWGIKSLFKLGARLHAGVDAGLDVAKEGAVNGGLRLKDLGAERGFCSNSNETERTTTREQAARAMNHARDVIRMRTIPKLREMAKPRSKTLLSTINLLQEVAGRLPSSSSSPSPDSLSPADSSHLVDFIEPYIYGDTPMYEALESALDVFRSNPDSRKILFLLSDGEATDKNDSKRLAEELRKNKVLVFACLLTAQNISHPRRLYYKPEPHWTEAQRVMFELSSTVENTHPAMSILLKQKWEPDDSGHSRLFIQANHPDVIKEFANVIQYMSDNHSVLLDMIGHVSLDMYINARNSEFEARDQGRKSTCYAYAVATVFHLAMRRIEGREGGVPDFQVICNQLIAEHGENGAITENVLEKWASEHRLHFKKVDESGARRAIIRRRPVVATFHLNDYEWGAFSSFYSAFPTGILDSESLKKTEVKGKSGGHAVVLIKCDPDYLTFINSWSTDFADGGFFRVQNQVLNLRFYDVYWYENELMASEIEAFKKKCVEEGQNLVQKLPTGIQNLPYRCPNPHCYESLPVNAFILHFSDAECPKCHQRFKPTPLGLDVTNYAR